MPAHAAKEGRSPRKMTAENATETGIRVPISEDRLGPRCIRERKKNVSPSVIPSKPLIPR